MKAPSIRAVRCAVYTRVSTEYGLDQEFNSLDAQYDAASAYIKSQAHAGWMLFRSRYDDGGYSGGSTDRPDLQRLLDDIRSRKLDVIVVYKVDRLTRSLADFAKLSINITPKEFQRRMIGAANRHHAAMQGMTDNEAASYVRRTVEAAVVAFGVYPNAGAPHGMGLYALHTDLGVLAQHGRALLRRDHPKTHPTRRLQERRRAAARHHGIPGKPQRRPQSPSSGSSRRAKSSKKSPGRNKRQSHNTSSR
jgi:hypothetical protein